MIMIWEGGFLLTLINLHGLMPGAGQQETEVHLQPQRRGSFSEKERDPDPIANLLLSPICGKRYDGDIMPYSLPTLSLCNLKRR